MFSSAAAQIDGTQYVDDVFSTYLYTGNGSTQTITNGIDLAGKGGLVWIKQRSSTFNHTLHDTANGANNFLATNTTDALTNSGNNTLTAFSSTGFSLSTSGLVNNNTSTYASWTFRKAAKFFDCGTFTAGTSTNRRISHSLGVTPGLIIVKEASTTGGWEVWHNSFSVSEYIEMNTTAAKATSSNIWGSSLPTATDFGINEPSMLINGSTAVWYAFAHDTTTDGLIQCGSFTTDGSGNATVTLGWEPQFVLYKTSSVGGYNWTISDSMRGLPGVSGVASAKLYPNVSDAEATSGFNMVVTATGLSITGAGASLTYIYLAIRRPNKPPTTGTQVYNASTFTGADALQNAGFPPDFVLYREKDVAMSMWGMSRLTAKYLTTDSTSAETSNLSTKWDAQNSFVASGDGNSRQRIYEFFRRAPGVFDVVAYSGNGSAGGQTIPHSLGVAPNLWIIKSRSAVSDWFVGSSVLSTPNDSNLRLNTTAQVSSATSIFGAHTASNFILGSAAINSSSTTYVAYLFATKAGISYVGSYTGNGSSQTINCGFTTGARFVMIKRTDAASNWFVIDTARGLVAGNDPHLSLNTTAAEVTTDDSVDTDTSGFIVNQLAATNVNVTSATYIVLALA